MFTGYKTYIGAAFVAVSAILRFFDMQQEATLIEAVGGALAIVGIRAKLERGT